MIKMIIIPAVIFTVAIGFAAEALPESNPPAPKTEGAIYDTWRKVPFTAVTADTPEAWSGNLQVPPENGEGILFQFTTETLQVIDCGRIPFECDILFISRNNRIDSILEQCESVTLAASVEPCTAALCMPAGFVSTQDLEPGLIVEYERSVRMRPPEISVEERRRDVLAMLDARLDDHPGCTACRIALAGIMLEDMQYSNAAAVLQPVLDQSDPPLQGVIMTAKAMALQGRFDMSLNFFNRALEKAPDRASTVIFIERTLRISKSEKQMRALLGNLLEQHPENTHLIGMVCRSHLRTGEFEAADRLITSRRREMPGNPDLMRIAGDVALRRGDHAAAAEAYLQYIQAGPLDPHIRELHSFVLVHKYRKKLLTKAAGASVTMKGDGEIP